MLNNYYLGNNHYMKIDECHKKLNIEYIEQYINRITTKFYKFHVDKIDILKKQGQNITNEALDKIKYPH